MRTPVRLALGITSAVALGTIAALVASSTLAAPAPSDPIVAPAAVTFDAAVLSPASVDGVSTLPSDSVLAVPRASGEIAMVAPDMDAAWAALDSAVGAPDDDEPTPADDLPADVVAAAAALDAEGGDVPSTPGLIADAAAEAAASGAPTPGDPCAEPGAAGSGEGTDAACPDGVESAIFADTHLEELDMWVVPSAHNSREGVSAWCEGAPPGEGELWLDVVTNLPAGIHARYWPASDPADVRELDLPGVASEEAAWQAEIDATGTYTLRSYLFQHCALLTGLEPSTDYVVSAVAIDTYLRVSLPEEARFNSAGAPTIPTMFAVPLGQSLLYVGVPYTPRAGEPWVKVATYVEGETPPSCGDPALRNDLSWAIAPHAVDMSADYLHAHNYASAFSKRFAGVVDVPEGTNAVVCAQWFDDDSASFDRGIPTRFQTLLAASPDTATPVFTLENIRTIRPIEPWTVLVTGSTTFGRTCGQWNGPIETASSGGTLEIGEVLCDRHLGSASTSGTGSGSTNSLMVTASFRSSSTAERIQAAGVIRVRSVLCAGADCDLPPDSTYSLPLPAVRVGTGLCGSSFGSDCTPPTRETSLGVATISVRWDEGASNGLAAWSVGTSAEGAPDATAPDAPQFDLFSGWHFTLSHDAMTAAGTLEMRVDRPVSYAVTVSGDCWMGTPPGTFTGRVARAEGAYYTGEVAVSGMCAGSTYAATVELVDDAGHRTVASSTSGPSDPVGESRVLWPSGSFWTPQGELELTFRTQVLHGYPWNEPWWIAGVDVDVNGGGRDLGAHFDRTCRTADENNVDGTLGSMRVPMTPSVHISAYSRFAVRGLYFGHAPAAPCAWEDLRDFDTSIEADLTPAQLLRGVLLESDFFQSDPVGTRPQGHLYIWVTATRVDEYR